MQYKCDFCKDTGSFGQDEYLDCNECDVAQTRRDLNDFVKSLGPTHPEDVALAIHQRALAMAPKQEARQWVAMRDSEWMNIVNHDTAYHLWSKDDAVHHAVKLTEAKCKELNGPGAAPEVANGALTDAKELSIYGISDAEAVSLAGIQVVNDALIRHKENMSVTTTIQLIQAVVQSAAILAGTGPDAALVDEQKAFEAFVTRTMNGLIPIRDEKNNDWYYDDFVQLTWDGWKARAALSGAKGN